MRERFAAELIKNGGKRAKAAIAAGYSPKGARQTAHRLLTNVDVQERIRQAKQRAGITPEVVSGVLAQQLLGDISDFVDEDGRFDYQRAKALRVTGQIQKLKIRSRKILNTKGDVVAVETIHELELYSSQRAAQILTGTLGMLKQPAVNPEDVARVKAEIDRLIAEGWSEDEAKEIVVEAEPRAAQWLRVH
jgi:phage terminase small subunit